MYVVHVFPTKERARFSEFRKAFAFWRAARLEHRGVAMWDETLDGWTRVYATEGYPEHLTRPWCK